MSLAPRIRLHAAAALTGLTATLVPQEVAGQQKADPAFGEYLASECTTCHQRTGQYAGIPPIVGWPEEAFVEIMNEYRHKKRENPVMQSIVARLSDAEVAALAAYFGSLAPQPVVR